ncbi:MAG: hypothetical protein MZV70_52225 [Desulfobacterales bacterium]|nr:hypothetical protein [Desulfobacterales bacterium]
MHREVVQSQRPRRALVCSLADEQLPVFGFPVRAVVGVIVGIRRGRPRTPLG